MRLTIFVAFVFALLGCGTDSAPQWVPNFDPPPVMPGYTRYVTPTITGIEPGANVEWCQWVADPSDGNQDILDVEGYQSQTGHHAVLYATTETQFKVGESHVCTSDDMLSISFVGGVGGEGTGGNAARLPDGLFLRLPKGQALMANTHWLNATDNVVDGQAVIDLQTAPHEESRVNADLFVNNGDTFQVDPGTIGSYDNSCVVKEDLNLAMVTNHMHNFGSSVYTEVIHTDGTKDMLRTDAGWVSEWQFNPMFTRYTVDAPHLLHVGDTVHTHCEWNNVTSNALLFPDEMCVGITFYFPSHGMITCENGGWSN